MPSANLKSVSPSGSGTESYYEKQLFKNALPDVAKAEIFRRNGKCVAFEVLSVQNPNF